MTRTRTCSYEITPKTLSTLKSCQTPLICKTCQKPLGLGDIIHSKRTSRSHKPLRHYECARRVNLV